MNKIREWMHGKGRSVVMLIVCAGALYIVLSYFFVERHGQWGAGDVSAATSTPASTASAYVGGDSLGPVPSGATITTGDAISTPTPDPTETTKVTADKTSAVTLGFAGDICLDDTCAVMKYMRHRGGITKVISNRLIKKMNSYNYMFLNNEFSISNRGTAMPGKAYTFRAKSANVSILKKLGVDGVSLANNHVFDYGETAFRDTMRYLNRAGIDYAGGGRNIKQASKPVYIKKKGKKIAIVAATRAEKYILTPAAGKNSPGVLRTYDDTRYVKAIKKAKRKADYVVAYVHWGTEYSTNLETAQKQQARDYIDAGADIVIGAHTHCMQGVGYYKGKPIFYSLGNFWFNEKTLYTTLLQIKISARGRITATMLPCIQSHKKTRLITEKSKVRKYVRYINSISTNGHLRRNCTVVRNKKS